MDPIKLTQDLIRCESVTPADAGALDVLEAALKALGFKVRRMPFHEAGTDKIDNLYARLGTGSPNLCFAGHTDVVPAGHRDNWSADPFAGEIRDGLLYGRGAADMKGAIAAYVAACADVLAAGNLAGSLSLLITGDEEGPAINGTRKMLDLLAGDGEQLDYCIVGEPTNPAKMGEMIKIGRRGSMNIRLSVKGEQGHVAYPHLADNPVPGLTRLLSHLPQGNLDEGTARFQPSNLEVTALTTGTEAFNVIPGAATALFNVRFSDLHTGSTIKAHLKEKLDEAGVPYDIEFHLKGEAFLSEPGSLADSLQTAIKARLGTSPELSTTGGTSDARYIKDHAEVVEFGLVGKTMHAVDEHVATGDIEALRDIYAAVIRDIAGAQK